MKIPFNDLRRGNESIKLELESIFSSGIEKSDFILGQSVKDFESDFANYLSVKHCIGTGNCTDALEIAFESLGIGPGDEVLVPSFSVPASASSVVRVGAKPVFVDVDPETRLITAALVEDRITDKTKALVVVHLFGLPLEMDSILELSQERNLYLIEDCAQSAGASIGNQKVGVFGDAAVFSFYPTKNLGALGDGGAFVTNNDQLAKSARDICNQWGISGTAARIGRNSRLDSIQAEILRLKLGYLDEWNSERRQIASVYQELLRNLDLDMPSDKGARRHIFHLYTIQLSNRDDIQEKLEEGGIQTKIHYPIPLHKMAIFENYHPDNRTLPGAEKLSREILSLPFFPGISREEIEYVCEELIQVLS